MVACRSSLVAAVVAAVAIGGGEAGASPGRSGAILLPEGGERLIPGRTVDLRWAALPHCVDEFEVLLSLDGGRHYPVRLTPQLDPSLGGLAWTVPNLPTDRARLRLRWGCDGVEIEGPPSAAFAISARDGLPMQPARYRTGEWWLQLDGAADALEPRGASLGSAGPGFPEPVAAVEGSEDRVLPGGHERLVYGAPMDRTPAGEARTGGLVRRPRHVPLRR